MKRLMGFFDGWRMQPLNLLMVAILTFGIVFGTAANSNAEPTLTWTQMADMPTPRASLGSAVVDGKIYAIGGSDKDFSTTVMAVVERYDPATDTWTTVESMPTARLHLTCSVVNGKARELQQKLQNRGILVRYFDQPLLTDYIRISVGKPEHTDALIKALKEIVY